ncbi:carbohydrate-binding module family 20 domain-containing protein [Oerskovia enterophila]|uniref:Alpha-amylase n=1 Tax=Oerskovia enterophila TaxID=43678 RepID=A0ABX2Y7X5_9CELL|nr:carbohydrate-binding module family 20 domain-containing protein [Oerskovia enterophila]OCI32695.1 alpha-amylase precursor [Oerskovia enterophila]
MMLSRTTRPVRRNSRHRLLAGLTALAVLTSGLVAGAVPASAKAPTPSPVVASENGRGNVVLNMFQWTWDAVAAECTSTIGPAGFGYVQVSPPQEHIQGTAWWTSYQPVSYKIESKLGNRAEFQNMVNTCRTAGVGIVVDAVVNHTAGADTGSGTGTGGTSYSVDSFPGVPYGANDFNDCRANITNYGDRYNVQNCRLVSLQDLRTSSDYVRGKIAGYMNDLLGLGVAGFRIDAAKHIPAADLEAIKARLTNPNVYWVHEVIGAAGEPIQPSEYLGSGDSHEFNYARDLKSRFDGSIKDLRYIADNKLASDRAGVFVDNHDTERNGETMNYKWGAKYKLANAFMLSWPYGSPSVYTGYTWTDKDAGAPGATNSSVPDASCSSSAWTCTQRWTEIAGMVGFHNTVEGTSVTNWWDDGNNNIAYGRGDKGYVAINNTGSAVTRTYQTSLPANTYCDVVASKDCSTTYTVSSSGTFTATVPAYGALALHVGKTGGTPCTVDCPTTSATTVYYSTSKGWSAYKVHYRIGAGAWTTAPGVDMTAACTGWVSREIPANGATVTAAFTNGSGTWDNNGGKDFSLTGRHVQVSGGVVTAGDPCAGTGGGGPGETEGDASFSVNATTVLGQSVYVVGSITALGSWAPASAKPLSAASYPVWKLTLDLPAGTTFEYKYVKKDGAGNVVWESGANRTATVGANGAVTLNDTWK